MASTRNVPVPVAGSRIWTKGWVAKDTVRDGRGRGLLVGHFAPAGGIGETVLEVKLVLRNSSSTERTM